MIPSRETKENRQHSTPLIPYSYYKVDIPKALNNVPMHWHSEFELNRILQGAGEFICGDEHFTAREGEFLLIPPNMLHAAYPLENHELVYQVLVFHPAMIGANTNDRCTIECIRPFMNNSIQVSGAIGPDSPNYAEVKLSVDNIFSCVFGNLPELDLLLKSELLRLFWLLNQTANTTISDDTSISYSELVRPALDYMMNNLQETISIDHLADISHLSKSYFMNCFKKAVGMGAIEHLTHLRINAACDALSDTNKMVSEIAFTCGYCNLSNFNRQFKQIMGCSPKEYRKRKIVPMK